jgi:hypothetical protein
MSRRRPPEYEVIITDLAGDPRYVFITTNLDLFDEELAAAWRELGLVAQFPARVRAQ